MQLHRDTSGSQYVSHQMLRLKEDIIERWKSRVCETIPAANYQTSSELIDSLPKLLDRLAHALASNKLEAVTAEEIQSLSEEHGEQRARLKEYSLKDMLIEYKILREVIFEVLEKPEPLDMNCRNIILSSIEAAMSQSGEKFVQHVQLKEEFHHQEYQSLLNSLKDYAIIKTDTHGRIIDWSAGAKHIFGYDKKEVLGRYTDFLFTAQDNEQGVRQERMKIAEREGRAQERRWLVRKDGSQIFATGVISVLFDGYHRPAGFVKVIRDETEIKTIETKLKRKTSEFETVFKAIPDTVIVANKDRIIVGCNPVVENFFGYTREELIGQPTSIFYADTQDFQQQGQDKYNAKTSQHETISYVARYKKKNGEILISETNAAILRDEKDEVIGYLAIMRDISERLRTDEAIHHLADALPQKVWTANKFGKIDYYNQRFTEYLGMNHAHLLESGWSEFIHPDDLPMVTELWQTSLKTGGVYKAEFRIKRHDGEYHWHLGRGVPVLGDEGEIFKWYGTNTDIHEQKLSYDRLLEERELRERFVSTLSHDLRTPLTAAKLSAQVIKRSFAENGQLQKSIDRVLSSLDRSESMIQNLLDANRINAGETLPIKPSECEILDVVHTTIEELRQIHGDRFVLLSRVHEVKGFWDCAGLRRIMENLCHNAVKYGDTEKPITIHVELESSFVKCSVHNEGNAIPPEDQKWLFEPYHRASTAQESSKKGWGIGLTLVKGLVAAHHGQVTVQSAPNQGTTFTVCLPLDYRNS